VSSPVVDTLLDQDSEKVRKAGYATLVKLLKQSKVYEKSINTLVHKKRLWQSSLSNFATSEFGNLNHAVPKSS